MNSFSNTDNSKGLLKDNYGDTALKESLAKKLKKMVQNKGLDTSTTDEEKNDPEREQAT